MQEMQENPLDTQQTQNETPPHNFPCANIKILWNFYVESDQYYK